MPKKEAPCDSNSLKSCSFPISEGSLVPKPGHTFQSPKRRYLIKSALSGCNLYATKWEWLPTPVFCSLKNDRMISVRFQGKPFNTTVIQVYTPTLMLKMLKLSGSMRPTRPSRTNTKKRCPLHSS